MVKDTMDTNGYVPTGYKLLEKLRGDGRSPGKV